MSTPTIALVRYEEDDVASGKSEQKSLLTVTLHDLQAMAINLHRQSF
jgi:hypothetical protein